MESNYIIPEIYVLQLESGLHLMTGSVPADPNRITFIEEIGSEQLGKKHKSLFDDEEDDDEYGEW